jgi:benzoyl-CoA reductase/2-hydroxyglutaryl-CoA dehydratase subunit BcrC/BadD/HgdB
LDNPTLVDLVENAHGMVVMFDTCNGFKHYADLVEEGPDPIECLARRYLLKPTCPRMPGFDERIEHLEHMIQNYSIDGVIYSNLKYCDYSLFEIPHIESYLKKGNVPLLVLENDYLWSDVERLKVRVEAFLELVRGEF